MVFQKPFFIFLPTSKTGSFGCRLSAAKTAAMPSEVPWDWHAKDNVLHPKRKLAELRGRLLESCWKACPRRKKNVQLPEPFFFVNSKLRDVEYSLSNRCGSLFL